MNKAQREKVMTERSELMYAAAGRALSEQELKSISSQNEALGRITSANKEVHTMLQANTGESLGLAGNSISFDRSVSNHAKALQALASIDLPGIQATMVEMTGYVPKNLPTTTNLFSNPDLSGTQAAVLPSLFRNFRHDASVGKMVLGFRGLAKVDTIQCNVDFLEANPNEAQGVMYHELGHLWTSSIMGLDTGRSETYVEAFAELFRSAAALKLNAQWDQATGYKGYDLLHGDDLPNLIIPHWQNMNIPKEVYNAGRFFVCNRLIEHLGGLDQRIIHGISKACDVGTLPYHGGSFEDALRAIEAAIDKKGFANEVLHDPSLQFGGMKPGPVALGMPAASGNGYLIECFDITSVGEKWGQSKQDYHDVPQGNFDINDKTFHFEGVCAKPLPFDLTLHNKQIDFCMKLNVTSGEVALSPEKILDIGVMGNVGAPAGKYTIGVRTPGKPEKIVASTIVITDKFRSDYQVRKKIKFPR